MDTKVKSELDDGSSNYVTATNREHDLRKLLAEERQRSEQRKSNYQALKVEHIKLQQDFLALQTETKSILEETKVLKDKKEVEVHEMKSLLEEKNKMIESLQNELVSRDPEKLKQKLSEQIREPINRLEKENSLLVREGEKLTCELRMAQQKIEILEKDLVNEIERVKLKYEAEVNLIRKEKEEMKVKFMEECKTPEGQRILNLTQDNVKLKGRVKTLQDVIEESQSECKKIQNKIEVLLLEQEKNESDHEKQLESLRSALNGVREANLKLEDMSQNNEREKEMLMKEIKRLEKELIKGEEKNVSLVRKYDQDKELAKKTFLKEKKQLEEKNGLILDQVKKLKNEVECKNESLTRIERAKEEKEKEHQSQIEHLRQIELNQKHSFEREKISYELRLKELNEDKSKIKEALDQCRRQLDSMTELRMNLEKESMLLRTKVESMQSYQEEVDRHKRNQAGLQEELSKVRNDLAELNAANKDLHFQKERYKEEYSRTKCELNEERKEMMEFKVSSERNLIKLKACIEDERNEMKVRYDQLQDEIKRRYKEKEEMKIKCRHLVGLIQKLQSKLKTLQAKFDEKVKQDDGKVSLKIHKQLKKQYKELKKRQNELTSTLINISKEAN